MRQDVSRKRILEIAALNKVTRGGLQAQITVAEGGHALDPEKALAAMRALNAILRDAEGSI